MRIDSDMQNYVGWKVTNPTRIKDKYGYRVILEYADGLSKIQQKSGFATEKKASADRDQTVASLYNGSYIVYANVRVKEYMLFWLKEDLYKRTESNHTVYNYTSSVNILFRLSVIKRWCMFKGQTSRSCIMRFLEYPALWQSRLSPLSMCP